MAAADAGRAHLGPPIRTGCGGVGPRGASAATARGTVAADSPLLSLAGPRRRRPFGSGEKCLLHRPSPVPHGAGAEAIRLHAVIAVGWSAVGGAQPFSRDDIPVYRDRRRR